MTLMNSTSCCGLENAPKYLAGWYSIKGWKLILSSLIYYEIVAEPNRAYDSWKICDDLFVVRLLKTHNPSTLLGVG